MQLLDEVKSAVRTLSPADRRKLALYILELEKEHFESTVGPQFAEDFEAFARVMEETAEKVKKGFRERFKNL
jgi:hypothetical protein